MAGLVPYEMPPASGLVVNGGETSCFELHFPSRAWINKIVIEQYEGDLEDFVATLFNHENACQGNSGSDSVGTEQGPAPARLYKVTPGLASNAPGYLEYFSETSASGGHGFVFCSQDKVSNRPMEARLGQPRVIYLQIKPEGSGEKKFAVVLGGEVWG